MNRRELRERILALIPWEQSVAASDVVATLSYIPQKAVWSQIVVMAMEGLIVADNPGKYDGHAMVRRVA